MTSPLLAALRATPQVRGCACISGQTGEERRPRARVPPPRWSQPPPQPAPTAAPVLRPPSPACCNADPLDWQGSDNPKVEAVEHARDVRMPLGAARRAALGGQEQASSPRPSAHHPAVPCPCLPLALPASTPPAYPSTLDCRPHRRERGGALWCATRGAGPLGRALAPKGGRCDGGWGARACGVQHRGSASSAPPAAHPSNHPPPASAGRWPLQAGDCAGGDGAEGCLW